MKKTKIYTILCRYRNDDGSTVDIELSKMLKRLSIEPIPLVYEGVEYGTDYGIKNVVKYNAENAYKVKYVVGVKSKNEKEIFDDDYVSSNLMNLAESLNIEHDDYIEHMELKLFTKLYGRYGNNYANQLK